MNAISVNPISLQLIDLHNSALSCMDNIERDDGRLPSAAIVVDANLHTTLAQMDAAWHPWM